ncbi:MAG: DUF22 domain-containing protein [Halobacteriota archaeon]|nr:DUF22 domain-containing protein [Halobacteriota archaeon]
MKILLPLYIPSLYKERAEKISELVKSTDAEVYLLYIFDEGMRFAPTIMGAIRDHLVGGDYSEVNIERLANKFFGEASDIIDGNAKIYTEMIKGKPQDTILKYAKDNHIDIAVMPYDKVGQKVMEKASKNLAVYQIKGEEILKEVRVVDREEDRVLRKEEIGIFNAKYDVGEEVQFVPLIAAETKSIKSGEVKSIKISTLNIPPNYYAIQSFYARHGLGHPIAMGGSEIKKIEDGRTVDYISFLAVIDGTVEENDLLGAIALFPFKRT